MENIPVKQLVFILVMAILLLIIVPVFQARTGKDPLELMFGSRKKKKGEGTSSAVPAKEPRINNGTKGELTAFVAQLLRFTNKNHMRLVAPGTVAWQGRIARITAFVVAPGQIIGVYCLGFGGRITAKGEPEPWRQHINGEDRSFENPMTACKREQELVRKAMDDAGIRGDLTMVTVFTNARATLYEVPSSRIFTQKGFMDYLASTTALKNGDIDPEKTAKALAALVKLPEKKKGGK